MDCTDWVIFIESSANVNEETNVICGYIKFCEELCIPVKQLKCFPNNEPWVDSDMKNILCQKRYISKNGTACQLKDVKIKVKKATMEQKKDQYRVVVENQFAPANEMNVFFARFEPNYFVQERALGI